MYYPSKCPPPQQTLCSVALTVQQFHSLTIQLGCDFAPWFLWFFYGSFVPLDKCNPKCYINVRNAYELSICHGCSCPRCPGLQTGRAHHLSFIGKKREYEP